MGLKQLFVLESWRKRSDLRYHSRTLPRVGLLPAHGRSWLSTSRSAWITHPENPIRTLPAHIIFIIDCPLNRPAVHQQNQYKNQKKSLIMTDKSAGGQTIWMIKNSTLFPMFRASPSPHFSVLLLPTVPHISDRQSDPQLLKPFMRGFF
jgi:hypothetical protein